MPRAARPLLSVVLAVLLVAGCGEHKTPLGKLSDHDLHALSAMSADMRGFSTSFAHLIKSLQGEDVPGSRTAVDGMKGALAKASGEVAKMDAKPQRGTMQRYLGKMRGVTTAADRLIGYYEHTSSPKPATVNRLVEKFRQTALAAHKADETLIANILKHSTPAQRKQLRAALQRATNKYNQVVGG
jgi:hypothetical protein